MKPGLKLLLAAIASSGPALAQSALAPFDISAGFTGVRAEPGDSLNRKTLPGWNASFAVHPFSRLGFAAEFAGSRRTVSLTDAGIPDVETRLRRHTFLFGPSVRILRRERVTTTYRALFGIARGSADVASNIPPSEIGAFQNETVFAAAIGSAWDIRISRSFAWRVNPTLLFTRFAGGTQLNPRLSTGLLFRFGRPKH